MDRLTQLVHSMDLFIILSTRDKCAGHARCAKSVPQQAGSGCLHREVFEAGVKVDV